MAEVYLEPSDLSAPQALTVLGFLNRATSAEQLARDIEFPDEPDIGVRLGQRLLDARTALGGSFTDIVQVRAVRLIGPERFTEICVCALGIQPSRWVELFFNSSPMSARAEEGLTLALDVRPQPAWLGQPLTLVASVLSKSGEPRAGVLVTLHTDVGLLSHAYGFTVAEGAAVTAITGADGRAEVRLATPPDEPLSAEQEASLSVALDKLDVGAPHPLAIQDQLTEMAADYALDRNYALRRAVDLYVRQWRSPMVDSLNPGRWRLSWPTLNAVVRADAHPPEGGGTSLTHAVLTVGWKNWVGPWTLFLGDALTQQSQLDKVFQSADGGMVISDLVGTAHTFLAGQSGLAAEWAGKQVIDRAVRDYVGVVAAKLPPELQADAISQLQLGAQEMRPDTLGAYTVLTHTAVALTARIDDIGLVSTANLAELERVESSVNLVAAQVNAQALAINTQAQAVNSALADVTQKSSSFDKQFTQFGTQFNQFTIDYGKFNTTHAGLTVQLQGVQTELTGLSQKVNTLQLPGAVIKAAPKAGPG